MSSLRNSLHRRNHKERSQLSNRSRFGILEKHKDYVLRARDYHSKQDRIQKLKQKAADRNKDEFYFGMIRQKTQNGVHVQDRGNLSLPIDMVKVLKTQDENYIRTMRIVGTKKIEKIKAQLMEMANLFDMYPEEVSNDVTEGGTYELSQEDLEVLQAAGIIGDTRSARRRSKQKAKNHIIFVDNEQEALNFDNNPNKQSSLEHKMTDNKPIDLGWETDEEIKKTSKSHKEQRTNETDAHNQEDRRMEAKKHRMRLLKELAARLTRDTQLRYVERELEMQRLLMGKGASRKVHGVEKVEGDKESDEDIDDDDDDSKKRSKKATNEKVYKPRVYKWRAERKR